MNPMASGSELYSASSSSRTSPRSGLSLVIVTPSRVAAIFTPRVSDDISCARRSRSGVVAASPPMAAVVPTALRGRRAVGRRASSRRSKHTTERSGRKTYQTLRITLGVHPWCGREIVVLGSFGDRVRAELPDGRPCYLPLSWTDFRPRPEPLAWRGRPVRLAPASLLALAAWIRGRVNAQKLDIDDRQKLDLADREDQKRGHGVGDQARARAASAAVVGKVGASSSGRARQRESQRGKR